MLCTSHNLNIVLDARYMRISHIGLHDNLALLSSTISRIYNKDKHEQVKAILFNKFSMDLKIFLFNRVYIRTLISLVSMACKDQTMPNRYL